MSAPLSQPTTGELVGPYRLEELVSRAPTGEVYRAVDTAKGRTVAVELISAERSADAGFAERFLRDVALRAGIGTPHIVPIHDYGTIDGLLFVEMQLVKGPTLAQHLAQCGPLPPAAAVRIVADVAEALDAVHAGGLVHGAVTTTDVLLSGAGHDVAYLVGWGRGGAADPIADRGVDVQALAGLLADTMAGAVPPPLAAVIARGRSAATFATAGELAAAALAALGAATDAPAALPAPAPPVRRRRRITVLAAAVIAAIVIPAATWALLAGPATDGDAPRTPLAVTTIDVGSNPASPKMAPDGRHVYTLTMAGVVSVDTTTDAVRTFAVAPQPTSTAYAAVAVSPDSSRLYVTTGARNGDAVVVVAIDTATGATVATHYLAPVGSFTPALDVSPDGTLLYATVAQSGPKQSVLRVLDAGTGTLEKVVPLGPVSANAQVILPGERAYSLRVNEDHTYAIAPVDIAAGTVGADLPVAGNPCSLALARDGTTAFASVESGIAMIDTATGTVRRTVPVTGNPCGVVLGPDQRSLYFTTNQGWFVFDLETDRVTQLIPHTFRSGWWHAAVTPDGRRAYLNDTAAATLLVADLRAP